LQFANVETFVVFRASTPIVISLCDWLFLGRELPDRRSACALVGDESPRGCHGRGHCECDRATRTCACECHKGWAPPFCANTTCPADCHAYSRHGHCDRGRCVCAAGWRGADCGTDVCPLGCSSPNGRCVDGDCVCAAGWRGRDCATSTCPGTRDNVPCSGHGTCHVSETLEIRCVCEEGFKGVDCGLAKDSEAGRDDCAARECSGKAHGHCKHDDDGPCVCEPAWMGPSCEHELCPDSCTGHGFCTDAGCRCYEGWRGANCSTAICLNECSDHGSCHAGICTCDAGWADRDCSIPVRQRTAPSWP
jgi:syndecan 4